MTDEEFIDNLQFSSLAIAMQALEDKAPKEAVVDYLHGCLAELAIDDKRRDIIERMAAKVAVDGFDLAYGTYYGLLK
jgi:hypothetical protein